MKEMELSEYLLCSKCKKSGFVKPSACCPGNMSPQYETPASKLVGKCGDLIRAISDADHEDVKRKMHDVVDAIEVLEVDMRDVYRLDAKKLLKVTK